MGYSKNRYDEEGNPRSTTAVLGSIMRELYTPNNEVTRIYELYSSSVEERVNLSSYSRYDGYSKNYVSYSDTSSAEVNDKIIRTAYESDDIKIENWCNSYLDTRELSIRLYRKCDEQSRLYKLPISMYNPIILVLEKMVLDKSNRVLGIVPTKELLQIVYEVLSSIEESVDKLIVFLSKSTYNSNPEGSSELAMTLNSINEQINKITGGSINE